MKKFLTSLLTIICFCSCDYQANEKPTVYFFISNVSESKKIVELALKINGETLFDQNISYTDIQPDLQYTPYKQLPKGKYTINVLADSGRVAKEEIVNLDSDKWIFINYGYVAEADSATKEKWRTENKEILEAEPNYLPNELKYSAPRIKIHIMDKEPIHQ